MVERAAIAEDLWKNFFPTSLPASPGKSIFPTAESGSVDLPVSGPDRGGAVGPLTELLALLTFTEWEKPQVLLLLGRFRLARPQEQGPRRAPSRSPAPENRRGRNSATALDPPDTSGIMKLE